MRNSVVCLLVAIVCARVFAEPPAGPVKVTLRTTVSSPQPVGTAIGFSPHVENAQKGNYSFRYSASIGDAPFHVIRDFSQAPSFAWTPPLFEHETRVRVTARHNATKQTGDADLVFRITSRIVNGRAAVSSTINSLVALYSAPPCPAGSHFRVSFRAAGSSAVSHTSLQPCQDRLSNSVYVAGMYPNSDYEMRHEVISGDQPANPNTDPGGWLPFHTGALDGDFPARSLTVSSADARGAAEPILMHSVVGLAEHHRPFATDLSGAIIWYLSQPDLLTRVVPGGRLLALATGANSSNPITRDQLVREFDLAGNILRETNASRVAEQLESRGISSDCTKGGKQCFSGFHHEAMRLPNGHTLVLAGLERMFPAGTQDSKQAVDILGDVIVDLDEDFQVSWTWNAFDFMDLKRKSLSDAKCQIGPGRGGCPSVFLADEANGWLHSNSLVYVPADGSVILSFPEQNWVVKVDYGNGAGTGKVLWRLGEGGDFTVKSTDPEPWFSYQHDPGFEPIGSNLLSVLDDGHELQKKHPGAHSRGQVWKLDEKARTAELVYNADLGAFSIAVGSAQRLSGGDYSFEAGFIDPGPTPMARAVETSPDGKITYAQQVDGLIEYRSFRLRDLYSAPAK